MSRLRVSTAADPHFARSLRDTRVVTHSPNIARVTDRIVVLEGGNLVELSRLRPGEPRVAEAASESKI